MLNYRGLGWMVARIHVKKKFVKTKRRKFRGIWRIRDPPYQNRKNKTTEKKSKH